MVVCRGYEVFGLRLRACRHKVCDSQVGFYVRVVARVELKA